MRGERGTETSARLSLKCQKHMDYIRFLRYILLYIFKYYSNPDNLVFTTETGRYVNNVMLYQRFKYIMRKLGKPEMRFHDLRHTYAVNSLRAGDDIKTVQENLGHSTAAFTLSTYAHATQGMKLESANRMSQFIKSVNIN